MAYDLKSKDHWQGDPVHVPQTGKARDLIDSRRTDTVVGGCEGGRGDRRQMDEDGCRRLRRRMAVARAGFCRRNHAVSHLRRNDAVLHHGVGLQPQL